MPNDNAAHAAAGTAADHRKRPRRRGDALNAAIFEATLAELAQAGYSGLTMERVAERARASKASLYRRWPGKVELVMDAVYHVLPDPEAATATGSLRGDLLAMLRNAADQLAGPAGYAIRGLLSDALRDPEQAAQIRAHARGNSLRTVREIVRRAAERGEVDAGAITDRQLETGHALMRFHFLTHGAPVPDEIVTGIVDEVVLPLFTAASGE
ncbi:TetR/AcrR family transcriptional regulator [Allosalinactinospora lopnorensis]|uniref:TetR/AcrR family transcriptional regulator n=1 Tax=Allosalinactinospora lopnorensis TaxID=1352348 RepID=UPI000623E7BE|nr:TetR/AcrR family transcriptional regulator [Allosalinactinospora lopnorensis]